MIFLKILRFKEEDRRYYYDINASEVFEKINFRDINKLAQSSESFINEGVGIILGMDMIQNQYILNGTTLLSGIYG